jgi:hypothetical protein
MAGGFLRVFATVVVGLLLVLGPGPQVRADGELTELKFEQLYKSPDAQKLEFSDRVRELVGKQVMIRGYMAPPLKATGQWFVLTKTPVALCPYCETDNDWPADIVVVYDVKGRYSPEARLRIAGQLDLGSKTDEATGFVSQLRLLNAEVVR